MGPDASRTAETGGATRLNAAAGSDDQLFRCYRQSCDRHARNELIARHLDLARSGALQFTHRGEPFDDLYQVAVVGLLRAVERFQPDHGTPFPAYARVTIKGELRRHFRDRTWALHVPRPAKDLEQRLGPAIDALTQQQGRAPTPKEVARSLHVSTDHVLEAMQARRAQRPSTLTGDRDPAAPTSRDDDPVEATIDRLLLRSVIDELPERERTIIELRFFGELSQRAIARHVGVSQVQVSRLLRSTLHRLRHQLGPDPDPSTPQASTSSTDA